MRLPGAATALCLALLVLVGGCSAAQRPDQGMGGQLVRAPTSNLAATGLALSVRLPRQRPDARGCPAIAPGFSCALRWHIRAVERYVATRPGTTGIVLTDRATGATWRNANARTDFPAASTIKLAMVTDLLQRNAARAIALTLSDWKLMYNALHESSDTAADELWFSFENGSFRTRIERFGMTSATFTASPAYWGFMYCSPQDLDHLMNYVLGKLPRADRNYLVRQLRHVAPIQQWGVWGAGPASHPGNKDGWEDDDGIWITNTVGFAGRGARYTLAIMCNLEGQAGFRAGADTITHVSALLFQGHPGPVPQVQPTP
ncbi:MAG: hypothetical protein ACM3ML_08040 [Micromonosporaceae bacterium]